MTTIMPIRLLSLLVLLVPSAARANGGEILQAADPDVAAMPEEVDRDPENDVPAAADVAAAFPDDPAGVAEAGSIAESDGIGPGMRVNGDTWIELHGYARMPLNLQGTPREPWLIDNDYYLSGFAYTRLYEPDWSEIFLSAHHKDYKVQFGLFASLYSDYATTELENQFGIAQASVTAERFLGQDPLSVQLGVFWDRYGYIEPYDTYVFGRTHQGGVKVRWDFEGGAHVQAGAGAHQERLQQNQGLTPVTHLTGAAPVTDDLVLGGYLLRAWTRDKRQLSPIQDGTMWVAGVDARYALPRAMGQAYGALSHARAHQVQFLAPALELLHSTGGRGLTENFLGTSSSNNGTGSLTTFALDAPVRIGPRAGLRVFGMATWARSDQVDTMDPIANKDRRMYLKWGAEPGYLVNDHVRLSLRYDRVILDVYDAENGFRVLSPRVSFPLESWGELFVMYSRYLYGDKIKLRSGQVPLETEPDENVFKLQAQAVW